MSLARWQRGLAVAVAALALTSTSAAWAGEAADKAAAQKLFNEGNQLLGNGDYLAALERFRAAHARFPSAKILLNIGTTLRQLGRNLEAAEAYEAYLKDPKADPARAAGLTRILRDIDFVIARIRIEVNEPGARVRLDGKDLTDFKSGVTLRVEPGSHTVVAERAGFPPAVQTLAVGPHEERLVTLRLALPEKETVVVTVVGPQRTIGYVLGGVGAAGLLAGAAAGVVAIQKNNAAKGHCGLLTVCDADGVSLGNAAKASALASTITLAAGAGVLITGGVLFFTSLKSPRGDDAPAAPAPPPVALQILPGRLTATWEGSW